MQGHERLQVADLCFRLRYHCAAFIGNIATYFRVPGRKRVSMQGLEADIRNRIVALVREILAQNSISTEVRSDARLVDIGLTSMDMVNLMLGVEAEFDFTIPQDLITPENFQSVATLERLVAGQLQAAKAA
jgi:acyl carrier protein